ncbi:MAG: VPLPA-CTERM sorting domain-containing protein [Methylovulum sp.]|nr:VPLPA-CTERM sorting domain-containing protein [Methylovulum sp.]
MFKKSLMALAIMASAVTTANASTVFSDNFDSNALGLGTNLNPVVPASWSVNNGTVDIIGNPNSFDFLPGNGRYIDLDGSSNDAGVLSRAFNLSSGVNYLANFYLAGSHRGTSESGTVTFGTSSLNYSFIAYNSLNPSPQHSNTGFTLYSLLFTPTSSGNYNLTFANNGNDNVGALLDNVTVTATPIPAAIWLFGSALAGLVGVSRRKASGLAA